MNTTIPETQKAVQLTGPDILNFNDKKKVNKPGPYQILGKIQAVGLCFSDLKLLKQFSNHARKSDVVSGIDAKALKEISSYVPNEKPTVPGHETVVEIVAIGDKVTGIEPGKRYLVQTDYRWIPTKASNAAFGYNFEGALQQYVILDQRVITAPNGESTLLPAEERISASAIALAEPWACVEQSYAVTERTTLKKVGKMLVVADKQPDEKQFNALLDKYGKPASITLVGKANFLETKTIKADSITSLTDEAFDDVIYFGSNPETIEALFAKIAARGILNIVLCGGKIGRNVETAVGRTHYGGIRIIGTTTCDPADSMRYIPQTGEIRPNDKIDVIGAGGPMGVMHVMRNLTQGVKNVTVYASDLDDERLSMLSEIAKPVAKKNNVGFQAYNPKTNNVQIAFDYIAIMAPVPQLVAAAIKKANENAIINIFAGIAAHVTGQMDLDTYIEKHMYFIGTSGSTVDDMKTMLNKVQSGRLDTNISVAAVSGLEGAIDGIRAVENHSIPGKIIVYPDCHGLPLTTLQKLAEVHPEVADCLENGLWNKKAESKLLEIYKK